MNNPSSTTSTYYFYRRVNQAGATRAPDPVAARSWAGAMASAVRIAREYGTDRGFLFAVVYADREPRIVDMAAVDRCGVRQAGFDKHEAESLCV